MSTFETQLSNSWYRVNSTYALGYAFDGAKLLAGQELARFFDSCVPADFAAALRRVNGAFAVVRVECDSLYAAVDQIRSLPLFYSQNDRGLQVSDDANRLVAGRCTAGYADPALAEYLMTGYVLGADTLMASVKQLQAGEILVATCTGEGLSVVTNRYYQFRHHDYWTDSQDALLKQWDDVLVGAFERFIHSVGDRTIVVPLSGGLDSRLIALFLKRLKCENVVCISYGAEGNWESQVSKQVAAELGYRWEFVPYTHELWAEWRSSPERQAYAQFGSGLTSLAHVQDLPAVGDLKRRNVIPQNSVFVPGHAADFIAGSHIPWHFASAKHVTSDQLLATIEAAHYTLWELPRLFSLIEGWGSSEDDLRRSLRERLMASLEGLPCESPGDAIDAFECWDWQERQAKFIANSIRVYEFWGYEWRLPFWDREVLQFWERVPLHYRLGKNLYDTYVARAQSQFKLPEPPQLNQSSLKAALSKTSLAMRAQRVSRFLRGWRNRMTAERVYRGDMLAMHGLVPWSLFKSTYSGRENLNSYLVLNQLSLLPHGHRHSLSSAAGGRQG